MFIYQSTLEGNTAQVGFYDLSSRCLVQVLANSVFRALVCWYPSTQFDLGGVELSVGAFRDVQIWYIKAVLNIRFLATSLFVCLRGILSNFALGIAILT